MSNVAELKELKRLFSLERKLGEPFKHMKHCNMEGQEVALVVIQYKEKLILNYPNGKG